MKLIQSFQIFTKVAELESFTRAADHLDLPKATVSQAITDLENHIGVQLLHRTTRQVKLTKDGDLYLHKVIDLLSNYDEVENFFNTKAEKFKGKVRVDMPVGFSKHLFIPNLADLLKKHPELDIELSSTDRYVDVIGEGFDCVIRVGNLNDSNLIARKTGELEILNCASPVYIKKYGKPKSIDDLDKHYLIDYRSNLNSKSFGFEYFDSSSKQYKSKKMKHLLAVNNSEAYTQAALNHMGIIQAPAIGCRSLIERGQLVEVLPNQKAEPMPVHILYLNKKNLPARVRMFIDWLSKLLSDYR